MRTVNLKVEKQHIYDWLKGILLREDEFACFEAFSCALYRVELWGFLQEQNIVNRASAYLQRTYQIEF